MGGGASCLPCQQKDVTVVQAYRIPGNDQAVFMEAPTSHAEAMQPVCWFSYIYSKYIPFMVRERFANDFNKLSEAEEETFEAAVAFVDISGFTKLSEWLIKEYGPEGAEKLNLFISSYFDKLIKIIIGYGGDIIKFAGDAMLVVWRNPRAPVLPYGKETNDEKSPGITRHKNMRTFFGQGEQPLKMLVLRAVMCNLHLLQKHNNFIPPGLDNTSGIKLQLHTGIGAGLMSGFFVGGVKDVWDFFVAGEPIQQMSIAGDLAKSGDVVISKQAYELLDGCAIVKKLNDKNFKVLALREHLQIFKYTPPKIRAEQEAPLTGFVPLTVKGHVEAGHNVAWLPEYRKVFIMFVVLVDIGYEDEEDDVLDPLQDAVRCVQEAVFEYEGTIARLIADDKGTRFKIAFGMPSLHHDNDAERVVLAALQIQERLAQLEPAQSCSIGIATGLVFCGEAGSKDRCEYTAVGAKVIVAARITSLAQKWGNLILCDDGTHQAAADQIMFQKMEPTKLKGIEEKVTTWQPTAPKSAIKDPKLVKMLVGDKSRARKRRSQRTRRMSVSFRNPTTMLGRDRETYFLEATIDSLMQSEEAPTSVVLIEGDGGIGKSALIADVVQKLAARHIDYVIGGSDGHENKTPYFPFRSVFEQMCHIEGKKDKKLRNNIISKILDGGNLPMAALVNSILGTSFEETPYLKKMNGDVRADHTQHLLLDIIQKQAETASPMVFILEDLQIYDSASWALTYDICMHVPHVLLLLTMRRPQRPYPPDYKKIRYLPITKRLQLEPLDKNASAALAAKKIGVPVIPQALADPLYKKTTGLPLYIEEVCQALLDQKLITIEKFQVVLDARIEREGLDSVDAKGSVQSVIVGRIDQLETKSRLTLQICAVIGQEVEIDLLKSIHPAMHNASELFHELRQLEEGGFLSMLEVADDDPRGSVFAFKHSFYQESAYNMVAFARRKRLHVQIAEYLEQKETSEEDVANFGLLAHHYKEGDVAEKALYWMQKAGHHALSVNANREAVKFFEQAHEILVSKNIGDEQQRLLAVCQANLGNALYAMGRYKECIEYFRAALCFRGIDIPKLRSKASTSLLKGGLRDTLKRRNVSLGKSESVTPDREGDFEFDALDEDNDFAEIDEDLVPLLEKMSRACLHCHRPWQAGYCSFHLVMTVGSRLYNKAVLALGFSTAAYTCLELGWSSLATQFHSRCETLYAQLVRAFIAPAYMARINFQEAMYHMACGSWVKAFDLLQDAMELFLHEGDSKRWRESNFQRAVCLFHLCSYNDALAGFHDVLISAQKDGDMYFEASALYWKSLVTLTTNGASEEIYRNVRAALSIVRDLSQSKVPYAVLLTLNEYVRLCVGERGTSQADFKNLVDINLHDGNLEDLVSRTGALNDGYVFFHYINLILDALELLLSHTRTWGRSVQPHATAFVDPLKAQACFNDLDSSEHAQGEEKKHEAEPPSKRNSLIAFFSNPFQVERGLLERAQTLIKGLRRFSSIFPWANPLLLYAQGRVERINANDKKAKAYWSQALHEASEAQMGLIMAYCHYQLGGLASDSKETRKQFHQAIVICNSKNINYIYTPDFVAIHDLVGVAIKPTARGRRTDSFRHTRGKSMGNVLRAKPTTSGKSMKYKINGFKESSSASPIRNWGRRDSFSLVHTQAARQVSEASRVRRNSLSRANTDEMIAAFAREVEESNARSTDHSPPSKETKRSQVAPETDANALAMDPRAPDLDVPDIVT